jgi:HEAT repeat protein
METESDLFKQEALKELPPRKQRALLHALELLVSPEVEARAQGLDQLVSLDAHFTSPLTVAILVSRIVEQDLRLRTAIVETLAMTLQTSLGEQCPPERVRLWLRHALSHMNSNEILALLQIVVNSSEHFESVCCIMNACSFAGEILVQILADRKTSLPIRVAAAEAIGKIGFLDAGSTLESIQQRITGHRMGQMQMAFLQGHDPAAEALLPAVRKALHALQEASE